MPELVSILIPAYNAERWIAATIRSALAQTWPHTEVIIVDDGSTDRTLDIVRTFQGSSLKVITQRNMGAAAARNTAFESAQGGYIQWLDADDLLGPEKVAKQMELAGRCRDRRILLSAPWASFMYRRSAAQFDRTLLWDNLTPMQWMIHKWTHNLHMQTATWLVSRELTEAAGPWNTELLGDDDGEYFARVVLASSAVSFAPDAHVFYRIVGSDRLSYIGRSNRKMDAHLRSMELQIGYVRRRDDSSPARAAILSYLQTWLPVFYPERPDLVARMNDLARAVGSELTVPQLSLKYSWIDRLVGRSATKAARSQYNAGKTLLLRSWDRLLWEVAGE